MLKQPTRTARMYQPKAASLCTMSMSITAIYIISHKKYCTVVPTPVLPVTVPPLSGP